MTTRVSLPTRLQRGAEGQRSHVWRMTARTISEFRDDESGEQAEQQRAAHQYRTRRALERVMSNSPWEKDGQEYCSEKYETGTLLHYAAAGVYVERVYYSAAHLGSPWHV